MSLYIFQNQVSTAATELVAQEVDKFNAASGGALVLGSAEHIGDYIENTSWQLIGQLAQRRNAYGSGALTATQMGQLLERMVKIDGRIGPIEVTPTMLSRLGKNVAEAAAVVAAQAAEAMMQDYLNSAGAALKAAIGKNPDSSKDLTGAAGAGSKPSLTGLNQGSRLFGDAYSRIQVWLMSGATFHDFTDDALKNMERLYQIGDVNVMQDAMGRRFIVSDIPALLDLTGGAAYQSCLGLTTGALACQTSPLDMRAVDRLGEENIKAIMQGEYHFTLGVKGYQFKDGIKSPTDAQIATPANWVRVATSVKDTAGVQVIFGEAAATK
jgi:hypothetical protein